MKRRFDINEVAEAAAASRRLVSEANARRDATSQEMYGEDYLQLADDSYRSSVDAEIEARQQNELAMLEGRLEPFST